MIGSPLNRRLACDIHYPRERKPTAHLHHKTRDSCFPARAPDHPVSQPGDGHTPINQFTQIQVAHESLKSLLPATWAATVSKVGNDLVLNVTSAGVVDPYAAWAVGGVAFGADTNGDGVKNGLAWLLGAADPSANATDKLPKASRNGGNLRLIFRCLKSTNCGAAQVKVQSSSDLGASDPWASHKAVVPDADSTVNGVIFDTTDDGDFINVIADIPACWHPTLRSPPGHAITANLSQQIRAASGSLEMAMGKGRASSSPEWVCHPGVCVKKYSIFA